MCRHLGPLSPLSRMVWSFCGPGPSSRPSRMIWFPKITIFHERNARNGSTTVHYAAGKRLPTTTRR